MRVLLLHNHYRQRGGEDAVVHAEASLLASRGQDVRLLSRHNDEIESMGKLNLAAQTVWSMSSKKAIAADLKAWRPDVVHVHNTFPLLSPSIYWACSDAGVPVVQTLHNFRLLCPQAIFLREGRICEDCLGRLPWRGVVNACYRGSMSQSGVLAGMLVFHRAMGTWKRKVTRYVALNDFCRTKFIEGGLPAERIVVKPNFVDCPNAGPQRRAGFLFVGRLSEEKGISLVSEAVALLPHAIVRAAGSGPAETTLRSAVSVQLLGALDADAVYAEMNRALALLLPSICFESFPRTLVEAFANGLPVIASRLGALEYLVHDGVTGLLFEPGNALDLVRKMEWAMSNPQAMATMGRNARARYEAEYSADRNYDQLVAIYESAIEEVGGRRID